MAIKKNELYSSLWASCDKLRGGMDASQYKDYILTLLFVKYVTHKYKGVRYADITVRGNSLVLSGNRAVLTVRRDCTVRQRAAYVNEWYRGLLKAEIAKRLPRWEALTGLHCRSWQTRYMTTCWGTCNPDTGKIWFNLQLAKKNTECLDFVLLHELVHLREDRHSAAFVKVMDRYMPYWREVRRALNGSTLDGLPVLAAEL